MKILPLEVSVAWGRTEHAGTTVCTRAQVKSRWCPTHPRHCQSTSIIVHFRKRQNLGMAQSNLHHGVLMATPLKASSYFDIYNVGSKKSIL